MGSITKAKQFIKEGEVELIGISEHQIIVRVNNHQVRRYKELGYTLDSCSCTNHARMNKKSPRCSHKDAATTFLVMSGLE